MTTRDSILLTYFVDAGLLRYLRNRGKRIGNFVLNEFKVEYTKLDGKDKATPVKLTRPQATFSQDNFPIGNAIDNNPATGWAIAPQLGRDHVAVFEVQNKFGFKEGRRLRPR